MFVCAVCKKDFKSKGQMANHETSKAHKKKLKVGGLSVAGRSISCCLFSQVEGSVDAVSGLPSR